MYIAQTLSKDITFIPWPLPWQLWYKFVYFTRVCSF